MLIKGYITADQFIDEWLEDNELDQQEANYAKYRRWFNDGAKYLQPKDIKRPRIALVHLNELGIAELPLDVHRINEVAYRLPQEECPDMRRQLKTWTQKVWGEDCEVDITLRCNKCKKTSCKCDEPIIDIIVDPIFMQSNPWYAGEATRYGTPHTFSEFESIYTEQFKLMKYSTNTFHRLQWHVPNCQNLNCVGCEYSYTIDFPYIKTDIAKKDTEILISYVADIADEDGNLLCPDNPSAIQAIKAFFNWKRAQGIAGRTMQDQYEAKAARAEADWRRWVGTAKSELTQYQYDHLIQVFEDTFTRVRNYKRSKTGRAKYKNHLRS
jgi:hypothetical protein